MLRYSHVAQAHSPLSLSRFITTVEKLSTEHVNETTQHQRVTSISNMTAVDADSNDIVFQDYVDESQLVHVTRLVERDLSEPYSSRLPPTFGLQQLYSNTISQFRWL